MSHVVVAYCWFWSLLKWNRFHCVAHTRFYVCECERQCNFGKELHKRLTKKYNYANGKSFKMWSKFALEFRSDVWKNVFRKRLNKLGINLWVFLLQFCVLFTEQHEKIMRFDSFINQNFTCRALHTTEFVAELKWWRASASALFLTQSF